jgi:hypothetical protein
MPGLERTYEELKLKGGKNMEKKKMSLERTYEELKRDDMSESIKAVTTFRAYL